MDICRGVLRALFLDYPLSKVFDKVCGNVSDGDFLKPVEHLLRWRMTELTLTDTQEIVKMLKQSFVKSNKSVFVSLFDYLCDNQYNDVFVDGDIPTPLIRHEHLFRWMEIVKFIDSDLLTIAKMVSNDKNKRQRNNFTWKFVPKTDKTLFDIEKTYTDLHVHQTVTNDRFYIHWIDLMNRFTIIPRKTEEVKQEGDIMLDEWPVKVRQYAPLMLWKEKYTDKSYMDWIGVASIIRLYLFRFLEEGKTIASNERKDIYNCMTDCNIAKLLLDDCRMAVSSYRSTAFKEYLGKSYVDKAWDYSIQDKYVDEDSRKSPYCIFIGERRLIYNLLLKIEENNQDAKKMAPWLYLYLLIKNRIRMEHYLANDLVGLSNYNLTVRNSNSPMTEAMRMLFDKFQEDNSIMEVRMNEKGCDEFLKEREQPKWIKAILLISKSFCIEESKSIVAKYIKPLQKGKIAGVDFAGSDTEKRPRDFEDIIKYLRDKGIDNLTYHIGENFYDLVDGLRAIDEIMTDLNWQKPNRLAHLLALFTNADKYYERKHYTVTMPRKMLLDNLEWIRKNAPEGVDTNDFVLPHDIQNDEDIVVFKLNKTIVEVVKYNQDRIRTEIIRRGIPIETCPTSNLRIGYFSKYSELPTCSLLCDEESVVTINTDAPGILNTSLENEYNLIALALKKDKGKSESDIKKAVERLKQNAKAAMFG